MMMAGANGRHAEISIAPAIKISIARDLLWDFYGISIAVVIHFLDHSLFSHLIYSFA